MGKHAEVFETEYEFNSVAKIDVEDFKLNNCVRWMFTQKRQEEK